MKKTFSKVLSIVLVLVLTGLMCITASASVLPGSGTKKDPYTISTAAELTAFSNAVAAGNSFRGKFITVKKDIEANSSFSPIGTKTTPFKGTFDGNGKTLSEFDLECDYAGIFAFTDGAVISNINASGYFYADEYVGGIVAYAKDTVIENCTVSADIDASIYAGGIVGRIDSGKIVACSTESGSAIGNSTEYCGGIAGYSAAEISDCTNKAYTTGTKNVGGIAGYAEADIISCTNTTTIRAQKTNLGGIAGLTKATVKYCKSTGKISSLDKAGKIGGIAGVADYAEITECMNNGAVTAANSFVGGIVGYSSYSDIANCIATADVSNSGEYAGGIFGSMIGGTASNCVFTATVKSAKNNTKGAIGATSQGTVTGCYYNNSSSIKAIYTGKAATKTTGLAAADFTNKTKLSALDFNKVWAINTVHASYPLLVNIPFHTYKNPVSTEPTCTQDGVFSGTCTYCHETVNKITPAFGHTHMVISSQNATCTAAGYKDVFCTVCNTSDTIVLPATGHKDADSNNICDVCKTNTAEKQPEAEKSFFEKVADFFNSIIEWIRNLFAGIFG